MTVTNKKSKRTYKAYSSYKSGFLMLCAAFTVSIVLAYSQPAPLAQAAMDEQHMSFSIALDQELLASTLNPELMKQAKQFAVQISGTDKQYQSWANASITLQPLGPGTHDWLALVFEKSGVIGHMIIHASPSGSFTLGDYGAGDYES